MSGVLVQEKVGEAGVGVDPAAITDLEHPALVISLSYIGPERRGRSLKARALRLTFQQRMVLLSWRLVMVLCVIAALVVTTLAIGPVRSPKTVGAASVSRAAVVPDVVVQTGRANHGSDVPPPTAATTITATTTTTAAQPTVLAGAVTPDQLGVAALALVHYPWQQIPGYSITFLPMSAAPEAGFEGNTTFTWGAKGGVSDLYVYPGETATRLAGITAFEIGHEVDAAYVDPGGGHAVIENILGVHPGNWAPNCDCAEQGYLSGWYAAAFSARWSPGVGSWSQLAALPSGGELTALEPWLSPALG